MAPDGRRRLDEGASMTPASLRQLRTLLGLWETGLYDIGALDHASGRVSLREDWSRGQVLHARGWIAARNASGSSLYARPARSLGADARSAAGRRLAREYAGEPGAADGHPFGRLPGTTNRTPGLELANGKAPFAKLARVHPERKVQLPGIDVQAPPATEPAAQAAGGSVRCGRVRRDQSAIDFAIACRLAETGRTDAEIAAVIRSASHDAKADRPEYIARTIAAARRRVGHHPEGAPSVPPKTRP